MILPILKALGHSVVEHPAKHAGVVDISELVAKTTEHIVHLLVVAHHHVAEHPAHIIGAEKTDVLGTAGGREPLLEQLLKHRRLLFRLLRLLLIADESYFSHDPASFPNFSIRSSRASSHGVSGPYLLMKERKQTTSSRTQRKV